MHPLRQAEAISPQAPLKLLSKPTSAAWTVRMRHALGPSVVSHAMTAFKKTMSEKTAAIQGSGWGWLGYNSSTKKLEIVTTPNQDPLICSSFRTYSFIVLIISLQSCSARTYHRYRHMGTCTLFSYFFSGGTSQRIGCRSSGILPPIPQRQAGCK